MYRVGNIVQGMSGICNDEKSLCVVMAILGCILFRPTPATVAVRSVNATHYRVCADAGAVVKHITGKRMRFTVPEDASYTYIRMEAFGLGAAQAWPQPFFLLK